MADADQRHRLLPWRLDRRASEPDDGLQVERVVITVEDEELRMNTVSLEEKGEAAE